MTIKSLLPQSSTELTSTCNSTRYVTECWHINQTQRFQQYIYFHCIIYIYKDMYSIVNVCAYIYAICNRRYIIYIIKYYNKYKRPAIGIMVRVFINGPGDLGSILRSSHTKRPKKMVLDSSLLNTQHYKVWIKCKVDQSRERSSAHPYTLV